MESASNISAGLVELVQRSLAATSIAASEALPTSWTQSWTEAPVPPALLPLAAAGCLVPFVVHYLYRKCKPRPSEPEVALASIHFYSGKGVDEEYTRKCIAELRKHPQFVNQPLSDRFGGASHGYTPFLRACWHNNYPLISFMMDIGADIHLCNADGESALYLVAYRVSKSPEWDPRALNLLWNAGCSVDHVNVQNNSMLHLAAKAGSLTLVQWLLLHGADPEVVNSAGFSPRRLALKNGSPAHLRVAQLLDFPQLNNRQYWVARSQHGITLARCETEPLDEEDKEEVVSLSGHI